LISPGHRGDAMTITLGDGKLRTRFLG
jgi:hypothetical protein